MEQKKTTEYKDVSYENLDKVLENTIIIKSSDGIEKRYNESEMRKQFAPSKATDAQWNYFKTVAQSQGLDPYDKDIYMSIIDEYEGYGEGRKKIGEKVVPLTGYLVYVKRSLASGKMKSAPQVELTMPDEKNPDTWYADYSVERTDIDGLFKWRVWMKEVNKKRSLWNIQPRFQLIKTTLSQGTRVWFSDVVGGFPYTPEEITQDESSIEIEGTMQEGKVEPDEEEKKRLEDEKRAELAKLKSKIDSFETIESLDKWYSGSKKLQESIMKNDILKMIEARRKALTPNNEKPQEQAMTRTEAVNKIVGLTNEKVADVNSYVSDEMLVSDTVTLELLAGNADAVVQFKRDLHEYLQSVNDVPETEYEP